MDMFPVIPAEMLRHVQIQVVPEGQQGLSGPRALSPKIHRPQPTPQPLVTHIVGFPFADDRPEGVVHELASHQHRRKERQVLIEHRVLQSDAGGRDQERVKGQARSGPASEEYRSRHQVGVGLSDPRPGVAQGDAAVQHGVQHPVAQIHLGGALRHAMGGEQFFENMVDLLMGVFPVILIHPYDPLSLICLYHVCFVLIVFAARPPMRDREQYG